MAVAVAVAVAVADCIEPALPRSHGTVALVCRRWLSLSRLPSLLRSLTFDDVKTTHCDWLARHAVEHVQQLVMYDDDCSEAILSAVLARCTQLTSLRAYSVGEWAGHALPKLEELRLVHLPPEATLPPSLTLLELDQGQPRSLSRQVRWWAWWVRCPGGSLASQTSASVPPRRSCRRWWPCATCAWRWRLGPATWASSRA